MREIDGHKLRISVAERAFAAPQRQICGLRMIPACAGMTVKNADASFLSRTVPGYREPKPRLTKIQSGKS
jgi:hypothetical protein